MGIKIDINGVYKPSKDVVARDIQGELVVVPIASGIGDLEEDIFSLNETGRGEAGNLVVKLWSRERARTVNTTYKL